MTIQYPSHRRVLSPAGACNMPQSTTAATPSGPSSRPFSRFRQINKVAVLGAGTMGSRIAAHVANAGVPVMLLDIVTPGSVVGDTKARNAIVNAAMEGLTKSKPAAFFDAMSAQLITVGNFEDDLEM